MTETIDPRDFGALEAKVEELEKKVDKMTSQLDSIILTLNEAKGGWKVLMLIAGAAGAFGAGVVFLVNHVSLK